VKARKKAYRQKPEAKARAKAYRQKPEAKARAKAYYQKPEVRERRRASEIRTLMGKYQITEDEARVVRGIRVELGFQPPEQVANRLRELQQEEGPVFTEMVMDGIPRRKGIKEGGI
jgi:thioredoxin reductase